jgi:hypothetical protein
MSQIEVAYSERLETESSLTGASYGNHATPVLASSNFVAGKKYLILARAEMKADVTTTQFKTRLTHGGTAFTGSEMVWTTQSTNDRLHYHYMTVWTAVASEDINIQSQADGTNAARLRFGTITAIRLSDNLTENTDWRFVENTTPLTLTTTATDHGSAMTFTPVAGHRWLIIADGEVEEDFVANQFCMSLVESGGASATWEMVRGGRAVGDTRPTFVYATATLGAVSQTFKIQGRRIATGASTARLVRSAIFAIDLDKFDVATLTSDDTDLNPGTAASWNTLAATISHTNLVASGNVLVLGYLVCDFETQTSATAYDTARVQMDNVDAYSADGVTNNYTAQSGLPRFVMDAGLANNVQPYAHISLEQLDTAAHTLDLDFGVSALGNQGCAFRRLLAISLDVTPPAPPPGTGGAQAQLEETEQKVYTNDYRRSRSRITVRCVDATDNATPEIGETGGQGGISVNGAAFSTTGVGTLAAVEASNGLYYSELTQAALAVQPGSLRFRYKSAATALFTKTVQIEECPWLDDGAAAGGGANFIDLEATVAGERTIPATAAIPAGSIVRLISGTGAGQSQIVLSYNGSRITTEKNWDVNPAAGTRYVVLPGLPATIPDVNPVSLGGDATALANLKASAGAILTGAIVSGTNTTTTITTNLPITVGGVATPTDHYKGRAVYFTSGARPGDVAVITGSSVSGANTVLTVDTLAAAPSVGNAFVVT